MTGIGTIVWKEWHELFLRGGRPNRQFLGVVAAMVGTPVFLSLAFGSEPAVWSIMTGSLMGFLPMFTIFSFVIDSFAGERERHTLETLLATRLSDRAILLGKLLALLSFALAFTAISALVLVALAPFFVGTGVHLLFAFASFGAGLAAAIHVGAFAGLVGIIISMKVATVRGGQQLFVLIVMLPFMTLPTIALPTLGFDQERLQTAMDWLPWVLGAGAVLFYALLAVLFLVALRMFRRDRLLAR